MLSESFLKSLGGLRVWSAKRRPGTYSGERRSPRKGRSVEFADYRNYTPGDDPRRVDWNIYARLEKPYIKLFEEEEDLTIYLLLDTSASMAWNPEFDPEYDKTFTAGAKWNRASQIALALGHIILASGDRLVVETPDRTRFGPKRGEASTSQLITFLNAQTARIESAPLQVKAGTLNGWLRSVAATVRTGMVILISDCLDESGMHEGLTAISGKLDMNVLQVLCPEELSPELTGDLRLRDVEDDRMQDVSLDEATLTRYRNGMDQWMRDLTEGIRKRGGRHVLADSGQPIEQHIRALRKEGWLT